MKPVRLAMGLLVGGAVLSSAPALAQATLKTPEGRRLNLDLKNTPFHKALAQVVAPGGLRVKLEADVPNLPVSLTLKSVDANTAFRLLVRQAKKQTPDLQCEPTDDGYRLFLGQATPNVAASPYPLIPQPKPLAPTTPDLPVVQDRVAEPFINELLQRVEGGEPLLSAPRGVGNADGGLMGGDEQVTYGDAGLGETEFTGNPFAGDPLGGNSLGLGNDFGQFGGNGFGFGSEFGPLGGNGYGLGNNLGLYGSNSRGRTVPPQTANAHPYSSPVAGGSAVASASQRSSGHTTERGKKPTPYFYDHKPQWILQQRTHYWGNGRNRWGTWQGKDTSLGSRLNKGK